MSAPVRSEVMCIKYRFFKESPPSKSPWMKQNVLSLIRFFLLKKPKIKICCMVAKEHPEVIEGRIWLIAVDVLDSEEAAEDASVVHDNSALDEEDGSGVVVAGVTGEVVDIQKALKYSSLLSYMLKRSHLLTHGLGTIGQHRRSYSNTCVILGHGKSGGRGEELSVLILMLIPPNINAVSSILRLWTASQVI